MNMTQTTELWIHRLGHFLSVLHCRVCACGHWVSFHFQQSCDELVWVTIVGKVAIFLALCLHSAVDGLLWQHSNKPIRKPSENVSKGWTQRRIVSVMRAKIV